VKELRRRRPHYKDGFEGSPLRVYRESKRYNKSAKISQGKRYQRCADYDHEQALRFFSAIPAIARRRRWLMIGVGYVALGRSAAALSSGGANIKLSTRLSNRQATNRHCLSWTNRLPYHLPLTDVDNYACCACWMGGGDVLIVIGAQPGRHQERRLWQSA